MLPVNLRNSAFKFVIYKGEDKSDTNFGITDERYNKCFRWKRLGNIGDIEIDMDTGKIESIIIAKQTRTLGFWKRHRNCNSLEGNCENWGRCHTC